MDTSFFTRRRVTLAGACLGLGALFYTATVASADNDPSTQEVLDAKLILPYDGSMMVDGAPFSGTRLVRFELYLSQDPSAPSIWSEEQSIAVYHGNFSAGLGSDVSLTDIILDAEQTYVGMTILADGVEVLADVPLQGRQAIHAAPYAAWSGYAADFKAGGDLSVAKSADVQGNLYAGSGLTSAAAGTHGSLQISGTATTTGDVSAQDNLTVPQDLTIGGMLGVTGTFSLGDTLELEQNGSLTFLDKDFKPHTLYGQYAPLLETGLTLRPLNVSSPGDHALRVLSAGGTARLAIQEGTTAVSNNLEVTRDASIQGSASLLKALGVGGDITNFTVDSYSIATSGSTPNSINMTSTSIVSGDESRVRSMCFLTSVRFEDYESDEKARCYVTFSNTNKTRWALVAHAPSASAQTVIACEARCLSW